MTATVDWCDWQYVLQGTREKRETAHGLPEPGQRLEYLLFRA